MIRGLEEQGRAAGETGHRGEGGEDEAEAGSRGGKPRRGGMIITLQRSYVYSAVL
jgi:hypothetical protein